MCRLLGIYGQTDCWQDIVLEFSKQSEFGNLPPIENPEPGHKDGWGMTMSNRNKTAMVPLISQLGSAHHSGCCREAVYSMAETPSIFLCHLRKASENIPVTLSNTHPFFYNGWAFIHNGTIFHAESLARDSSLKLTSDGSDTEPFFHYLLTKIRETPSGPETSRILADAVTGINVDYTALNSMLSNGRELYVISSYKQWSDYYTLHYLVLGDCVIISSQIIESRHLNPISWNKLPNNALLRVYSSPPEIEEVQIKHS